MVYCYNFCSDQWEKIEPILPGKTRDCGKSAEDNRRFIEGVLWVGRNGGRWRTLPREYPFHLVPINKAQL